MSDEEDFALLVAVEAILMEVIIEDSKRLSSKRQLREFDNAVHIGHVSVAPIADALDIARTQHVDRVVTDAERE